MKLLTSPFGSVGHALAMTVEAARKNGEHFIDIPCGEYHVYKEEASQTVLCVSNHGSNGYKSAALLIEDMEDLTVDCNGSKFILHGCMDFAIVNRSKNITVKNLTVTCADTCNFQGTVISSSSECVEIALEEHPKLAQYGNRLFQTIDNEKVHLGRTLEYDPKTRKLRRGLGDENFGKPFYTLDKKLDGDTLYVYDVPVPPIVGNTVVFSTSKRIAQAFLTAYSKDVRYENITVNTCWGMGFITQKSENITLSSCRVVPEGNRCWSAGQDATHFVNCRGKIVIENGVFENQLDDAVNIHGIYTKIEKIADNKIMVQYKHAQTLGIDIYSKGDRIQIAEQASQMPIAEATVTDVEVLNINTTILTLDEMSDKVKVGMIVESLTDNADVLIVGNEFRNNRARGMLLATKGRTEVVNNYFNIGGAAIQFESDPFVWYECGGTCDVLIKDNFFDDCKYGAWCRGVIDVSKRRAVVDGFYYHGLIKITGNRFTQANCPCVCADNVGDLVFDETNDYVCETPVIASHAIYNGKKCE